MWKYSNESFCRFWRMYLPGVTECWDIPFQRQRFPVLHMVSVTVDYTTEEPITRGVLLWYCAYVRSLPQTRLFLDWFWSLPTFQFQSSLSVHVHVNYLGHNQSCRALDWSAKSSLWFLKYPALWRKYIEFQGTWYRAAICTSLCSKHVAPTLFLLLFPVVTYQTDSIYSQFSHRRSGAMSPFSFLHE